MSKLKSDKQSRGHQPSDALPSLQPCDIGKVVLQALKDLFNDNAPQWAAAIAYYSLLSTFPLLLLAVSIAAFFVEPKWAAEQATRLLGQFLPQGQAEIERIIKEAMEARRGASILSVIALLWTGTRVFGAVVMALNIAYDVDETYGFWKRTLIEGVMLVTIGFFFVLALASGFLINVLWNVLQFLPAGEGLIFQMVKTIIPALLLGTAFFLIYRFAPRQRPDWRAALAGAVVATVLFLIARPLFLGYVQRFGSYNLIYGSIAIIIILVLWAWIVALITLFGGEIASHTQAMSIEGISAEELEQHHKARSPLRTSRTAMDSVTDSVSQVAQPGKKV